MWNDARDLANGMSPIQADVAGLILRSTAPKFEVRRGGKYIAPTIELSSVEAKISWYSDFQSSIEYHIVYSFTPISSGIDIISLPIFDTFALPAATVDPVCGSRTLDFSSLLTPASGTPIYLIAVSKADYDNSGYPDNFGSSCYRIYDITYS